MPCIVPIKDLKNTPVFITKNGYGDMVIMSMETYERSNFLQEVYMKIDEAEQDIKDRKLVDAKTAIMDIKNKYEL